MYASDGLYVGSLPNIISSAVWMNTSSVLMESAHFCSFFEESQYLRAARESFADSVTSSSLFNSVEYRETKIEAQKGICKRFNIRYECFIQFPGRRWVARLPGMYIIIR